MNIQYSKKKQELRKDPFMEFLVAAKAFVIERSNSLIAIGIAVVVIVGFVAAYNAIQNNQLRKAQDAFGDAMIAFAKNDDQKAFDDFAKVVENYGGSPQAAYSAFYMGSILMKQNKYEDAVKWFDIAKLKGKDSFVGGSAVEALGTCSEMTGDLAKAEQYFSEALKDSRIRFRANAIRWKLALISQQQKQYDKATSYCQQILADTSANAEMMRAKAADLTTELAMQKVQ